MSFCAIQCDLSLPICNGQEKKKRVAGTTIVLNISLKFVLTWNNSIAAMEKHKYVLVPVDTDQVTTINSPTSSHLTPASSSSLPAIKSLLGYIILHVIEHQNLFLIVIVQPPSLNLVFLNLKKY